MSERVVVDTSVLVAGLRSSRGASHRLLRMIGVDRFTICVSVPLVLEYEAVLKRQSRDLGLTHADIDAILDYFCAVGEHRWIYFLWRPLLDDPWDDMVLELAVETECSHIVTHNQRHFGPATRFGIEVRTPGEFLQHLGDRR